MTAKMEKILAHRLEKWKVSLEVLLVVFVAYAVSTSWPANLIGAIVFGVMLVVVGFGYGRAHSKLGKELGDKE